MRKHKELVVQMHRDIFVIDPLGAYNGVDRLGPALPEQKKEAKRKLKADMKLTTKETVLTNIFFSMFFVAFMIGRLSLGSNPIEDTITILEFIGKLVK